MKWKLFNEKFKLLQKNKVEVLDSQDYKHILEGELRELIGQDINLIGHRVVHGGKIFIKPTRITKENIADLEKLNNLAPLHNPHNVLGIKTCLDIFVGKINVAVFDTEFFENLSEKAFTYALPQNIVGELGFRRYGFHGISHEYVASAAAKAMADKKKAAKKIITVHLGGGASITAIKNGKAIDTSMGFTPLEGLVMMTRAGNIDSGVVLEIAKNFGVEKAGDILNKESGIKGICGEGDMLEVLRKVRAGDRKYKLALDVFIYSIQKYIGSYYAILGGCDVLVFTGSIGSGLKITRNMVCKNLTILGKTKVLAIETDEELAIAQKILNFR